MDEVRQDVGWQPIETAPKDGTAIVAWCVHPYASSMTEPDDYVGPVIARWIDHNGGGWTWHGHLGNFTHWMPLPEPPTSPTLPEQLPEAGITIGEEG